MKLRSGLGAAALILAAAEPARADDPKPPPRNALSLQTVSLLNRGLTLQYERLVSPPRISIATSIGARSSGGAHYDVLETGYGIEARLWLYGRAPFTRFSDRAMVGPYLGFRFDVGLTRVREEERFVGSSIRIAESVNLGARIAIDGRFELTPSVGLGVRTDFDPRGRLAPWTRPELLRFGLTAGALF